MADIKYPLTPEERHQKDLVALEKLRPLDELSCVNCSGTTWSLHSLC